MKFCSKCGKEIMEEAVICPNCGCAVEGAANAKEEPEDKVSIGLCVLSALIPLFGFIYWPLKHRETPKKARACGITAIVAFVVSIIINVISSVLLANLFGSMMSDLMSFAGMLIG